VWRAASTGSMVSLALVGFTSVYREGFETVLFYSALVGESPAGDASVAAGFAAGLVLLALVYGVLRRLEVRIPIRPFFLVPGRQGSMNPPSSASKSSVIRASVPLPSAKFHNRTYQAHAFPAAGIVQN